MPSLPSHVAVLACLAPLCSCAGVQRSTALESALESFASSHAPRVVAISHEDLDSGIVAECNERELLHAASTMKVPVMVELFRRADAGEIDLDSEIVLRNRFASIVDGSPYSLDAKDDSDPKLYESIGRPVKVRELLRRMIDASSNLATNVLIELVGAARVQRTIRRLGCRDMLVLRGVEDGKAYRKGLSNRATARDLRVLLASIARDEAASPSACAEMRRILFGQKFKEMIPAGLPPGTRVAHKTGSITRIHHDAAIVYPEQGKPYVLVVLTRGWDEKKESAGVVASAAHLVHSLR